MRWFLAFIAVLVLCGAAPLTAQSHEDDEPFADEGELPGYVLGLEIKAHYRDSDSNSFAVPFAFPTEILPPGVEIPFVLETVDAGSHTEISVITVEGLATWREDLAARVKVDFIDRYDRNPTSEDREIDVDELWLRYGREAEPAEVPDRRGWYAKIGKFGKFERQDDRHLESYGLVSTAFNRAEDVGLEVGFDLTPNVYLKGSFTQGNPLFFRDSNVLAGDNGILTFEDAVAGVVPRIKTGFPVLYDADVDSIDFEHPETGLGLGFRWSSASGFASLDVLAWGYERELDDEADLDNTFYGGDLDLLLGPDLSAALPIPPDHFSFPVTSDDKQEIGLNLWLYLGGFTLFGQWVEQDLAGLDVEGFEVEASWTFDLPWGLGIGGRQLFPWIAPAIRYSELDPGFRPGPNGSPAPSVAWDWEKLDFGLRFAVIDELDVTVEWQDVTFVLFNGTERSNDEFLVTLALALERGWPRR